MSSYRVVVVGLGVVGAATMRHLASEGISVMGLEAMGPTHRGGSSHGDSRIFRQAYMEGTRYLPLLERANRLWVGLDQERDGGIIERTGGLFVGAGVSDMVRRSRETAEAAGIAHQLLDPAELASRFPVFSAGSDAHALYEPGAYLLRADAARLAMIDSAVRQGSQVRYGQQVVGLHRQGASTVVTTSTGDTYSADSVVVATGAWMAGELIEDVRGLLVPTRMPIYWFTPRRDSQDLFRPGEVPVFLHESADGSQLYGCPEPQFGYGAVKVGFHNRQLLRLGPDDAAPTVTADMKREVCDRVAAFLPGLEPTVRASRTCFYTRTGDSDFILGTCRSNPDVVYASACSGHGFKFAPAIGEAMAGLALRRPPAVDLSPYSVTRFTG